jgi:hypothetical protein
MKSKFIFIFPPLIFLALFFYFFPRFYFNQLEYQSSQVFSSMENTVGRVEDNFQDMSGIEGLTKTEEEMQKLSDEISQSLNDIESLVGKHKKILNTQLMLKPLLPSKYGEFLNLKNEAFDKYYSSFEKFKLLKDYELGMVSIWNQLDDFRQAIIKGGASSDEFDEKAKDLENTRDKLKKYFDDGFMTKEYYEAMLSYIDLNIDLYKFTVDLYNNKYTEAQAKEKVSEITSKYKPVDIKKIFTDSFSEINVAKQEEWISLYNQSNEIYLKALDFYEREKLAYDPLSVFLSKLNKNYERSTNLEKDGSSYEEKRADLDGDGKEEILRLSYGKSENSLSDEVSLAAFDQKGEEIARLPKNMPIPKPIENSANVFVLDKEGRQIVSYDFVVGPHSSYTMFFGLQDLKTGGKGILPICFVLDPKSALDCMFWSGEAGSLLFSDFDGDGYLDVSEMVDEYPRDGVLAKEEEDAIKEVFGEGSKGASALRIAKREKGGRGKRVVWGIYSYNGSYFEPKIKDYEKYYPLVRAYIKNNYKDYPPIIKKSEISKDSLEYNEFMRNFWTEGLKE